MSVMPYTMAGFGHPFMPQLALQSPVDATAPWFDLDIPANAGPNDTIEIQYGTALDFSGATSVTTTLNAAKASHCTIDLARTALTNATTYYFRARYNVASVLSPWSPSQNYTVSTSALPKTRNSGTGAYVGLTFDGTMVIAKNIDLGPTDASRFIIASIGGTFSTYAASPATSAAAWVITDKDIAAGTFQGTALSLVLNNNLTGNEGVLLFTGSIPNGRSARLAFNVGNAAAAGVNIVTAYNLTSTTPTGTAAADRTFTSNPFTIGTITVPSGGFALAMAQAGNGYSVRTWGSGFTEVSASNIKGNNTAFTSLSIDSTAGSATAAITSGTSIDTSGIAAAWN